MHAHMVGRSNDMRYLRERGLTRHSSIIYCDLCSPHENLLTVSYYAIATYFLSLVGCAEQV